MASLNTSSFLSSSKRVVPVNASINVPKFPEIPFSSSSKLPSRMLFEELNGFSHSILPSQNTNLTVSQSHDDLIRSELYVILEAVADRVEMHHNIGEQRDNWNTLLLNSINMITLAASTMAGVAGVAASNGAALLAFKLSSGLLFSAATGMLVIMNKLQPSQLAEEQRNATRLFRQLQNEIETKLAIGKVNEKDVKAAMAKVLALDKAYPLPLLGAMIEKFPSKFEHATWWPSSSPKGTTLQSKEAKNGWNEGLEMELKEVMEVVKKKDIEDYERLGNLVLKVNKSLAIAGPLLTGVAAVGSMFISPESSWSAIVPAVAGALSTAINGFEHGGQVGMVAEMYRNCAGFFEMLEDSVQEAIEEDVERRENGELFEMKLALKLGRSLSQLRDLAKKSAYSRVEGADVDEFASKLF
ncbi:probable F-box protein At4g22030 [Neltuma alba]|uniref:probable F-box protein At4g22030 n=1 Tax=Neltuma alba TaxID=207710 RepID=UPI0010A3398F|nr:probable F-box protein At4g22030 [Prosopis alba]